MDASNTHPNNEHNNPDSSKNNPREESSSLTNTSGVSFLMNPSLALNPPPPPLPGVFLFDRPNQQQKASLPVDTKCNVSSSLYNHCSKIGNLLPSASSLQYTKALCGQSELGATHLNSNLYQSTPENLQTTQLILPAVSEVTDSVLPPDGEIHCVQSLEPVVLNSFDDSLQPPETKTYHQLHAISPNHYKISEEPKLYHEMTPVSLTSATVHKEDFIPNTYNQLNPVPIIEDPPGRNMTFQELKPVTTHSYDSSQFHSSKLYQQLCQSPIKESNYQVEDPKYQHLRPTTVIEYEQANHKKTHQVAQQQLSNVPVNVSPVTTKSRQNTLQVSNRDSVISKVELPKSGPTTQATISKYPSNSQTLNKNVSHVGFKEDKPKVYLELRNPSIRSQLTKTSSQQNEYSDTFPKYNNTKIPTTVPTSVHSEPRVTKSPEFKLPGPCEFKLSQQNSPSKFKLPKILGHNEYCSPESVMKPMEKRHDTNTVSPLGTQKSPSSLFPSTPTVFNRNSSFNGVKSKIALSLPKTPLCYGDPGVSNKVSYYPNQTTIVSKGSEPILNQANSSLIEKRSEISSPTQNTSSPELMNDHSKLREELLKPKISVKKLCVLSSNDVDKNVCLKSNIASEKNEDKNSPPKAEGVAKGGSVPEGVAKGGSAPEVMAKGGSAPEVGAIGGSAPEVMAKGGSASEVMAKGGSATEDVAIGGSAPEVMAKGGSAPEGAAKGGSASEGVAKGSSAPKESMNKYSPLKGCIASEKVKNSSSSLSCNNLKLIHTNNSNEIKDQVNLQDSNCNKPISYKYNSLSPKSTAQELSVQNCPSKASSNQGNFESVTVLKPDKTASNQEKFENSTFSKPSNQICPGKTSSDQEQIENLTVTKLYKNKQSPLKEKCLETSAVQLKLNVNKEPSSRELASSEIISGLSTVDSLLGSVSNMNSSTAKEKEKISGNQFCFESGLQLKQTNIENTLTEKLEHTKLSVISDSKFVPPDKESIKEILNPILVIDKSKVLSSETGKEDIIDGYQTKMARSNDTINVKCVADSTNSVKDTSFSNNIRPSFVVIKDFAKTSEKVIPKNVVSLSDRDSEAASLTVTKNCAGNSQIGISSMNQEPDSVEVKIEPNDCTEVKVKRKYVRRIIVPENERKRHIKRKASWGLKDIIAREKRRYKKRSTKIPASENNENCNKEMVTSTDNEVLHGKEFLFVECKSIKEESISPDSAPRKKRKYTRRKFKNKAVEQKIVVNNKRIKRKRGRPRKNPEERIIKTEPKTKVKYKFVDPLEEGLITDDEGEAVFLGFDMTDEEDSVILGFEMDSEEESGNEKRPFELPTKPEKADCITVDCDPRVVLQRLNNNVACSQCDDNFESHMELVAHMQQHSTQQHSAKWHPKPHRPRRTIGDSQWHSIGYTPRHLTQRHSKKHHSKPHRPRHSIGFIPRHSMQQDSTQQQSKPHRPRHSIGFTHHSQSYVCDECYRGFSTQVQLDRHTEWTHNGGKKYKCARCPKMFTTKASAKRHSETFHKGEEEEDAIAGGIVGGREEEVRIKTEKTYEEDEVESTAATSHEENVRATTRVHKNENLHVINITRFYCGECTETFETDPKLKEHESKVHNKIHFRCEKCSRYFHKLANLQRHQISHRNGSERTSETSHKNEDPPAMKNTTFYCDECTDTFKTDAKLKEHLHRVHNKMPFQCEKCSRYFKKLANLQRHQISHRNGSERTSETPHKEENLETTNETLYSSENLLHTMKMTTFHCGECTETFETDPKLKEHESKVHNKIHFKCEKCSRYFHKLANLQRHQISHRDESQRTSETPHKEDNVELTNGIVFYNSENTSTMKISMFNCGECTETFDTEAKLKEHENKVHNKMPFQCEKCLRYFQKLANLQRHKISHRDENESQDFPCAYCSEKFSSRELLHAHWPVHTEKKVFTCDVCNSSFTALNSLKRHQVVHTGEKLFRCEICQRSFSLMSTLKIHLLIHTGARRFECKLCSKTFNRRDVLKAHQWIHTGEKKFQCEICLQKFRWRHSVRSHKLIYHTSERPYVCQVCGKSFSHPDSFKKHAEVHADRLFYCQICLKSFSRPSSLKAHIITHTDLKPYFCDKCNKGFRSKSHLRNHLLVHTKDKPWLCKFCNKTFKDQMQLLRHKRNVHCKAFYNKILSSLPQVYETQENLETMADIQAGFDNQIQMENILQVDCDPSSHFISLPVETDFPQIEENIIPPSVF